MTAWPGCNAYQGTKSTGTGVWLHCEACSVPWEAHSPNARLLRDEQLPAPEPLGLEDTILVVLKRHRIDWKPGTWRCSCGQGAWTTTRHWNQHHAQLITEAIEHMGTRTMAESFEAVIDLSDPDANRAGIAGLRRTSKAAALRVQPRTGTQRRSILDYIATHGPKTDQQLQIALMLSGDTERPRRVELVEGGWLEEIDKHGLTEHGPAIRWGLTAQARARLQGAS